MMATMKTRPAPRTDPRPPPPADPWHAIIRARERYGLRLDVGDLQSMAARIERGDPRHVKLIVEQPDTKKQALLVWWWGQWVMVVFNPAQRRVVTFLPLHAEFTETGRAILTKDGPPEWRAQVAAELGGTTPTTE